MTTNSETFAKLLSSEARRPDGDYDIVTDLKSCPPNISCRRHGGGRIIAPSEPSRSPELHLFPHAGIRLTDEFLELLQPASLKPLAQLVVNNCDAGTPHAANVLIQRLVEGHGSFYVGVFDISRLFLDANRLVSSDQVPASPYAGSPDLYRAYLALEGDRLREQLLLPWIDAVNRLIVDAEIQLVFHHHSFDTVSRGRRDYDSRPHSLRPRGQLFAKKPTLGFLGGPPARFVPESLSTALAEVMGRALSGDDRLAEPIPIDDPLLAPALPFLGCVASDSADMAPWHVIYEMRKDLMRTEAAWERMFDVMHKVAINYSSEAGLFSPSHRDVIPRQT
jgi:hypothetical protein